MTRRLPALLALLLLGCAGSAPLDPDRMTHVVVTLDGMVSSRRMAGAVLAIGKDGTLQHLSWYGHADLEAKREANPSTIFRIYSMTKAITSAAALLLVEEGRLGLDDPVSKHVPETKDARVQTAEGLRAPNRPPVVRDLFLHTSGYTYGGSGRPGDKAYGEVKPLEAKDMDDFAARLGRLPLSFDPGEDWVYSISTDILGLVVHRVSGKPLGVFLQERIFGPLGMVDTGFHVPAGKVSRFAANYRRDKDGLTLIDAPGTSKYLRPPGFESGGGGLVGTAVDYLRFLLMVEGGGELDGVRVLNAGSVRLMTTNQLPAKAYPIYFGKQVRHGTGFGLGFNVRVKDTPDWDPSAREGEWGWGGAASTHYWASPRDRLVVVTMEQTMPYSFDTEWAVKGPIYEALPR